MTVAEYENQLSDLFAEVELAHNEVFKGDGNNNPEWPIWYADYLQKPMSEILIERPLSV